MTTEEALVVLDAILLQSRLSNVQELLFRQAWEGKTYQEIAEISGYDASYIRDVGYKLWQELSQAVGERVTKNNLQVVLRRHALGLFPGSLPQGYRTALPPLVTMGWNTSAATQTPGYELDKHNDAGNLPQTLQYADRNSPQNDRSPIVCEPVFASDRRAHRKVNTKYRDWGNAVDPSAFLGRVAELEILKQWIAIDRVRLVGVFGIGGIGKTTLAAKLAEQIQDEFDYVIWRSLRHAPPIRETLLELIKFLSHETYATAAAIGGDTDSLIAALIYYLSASRCLLVLDNVESVLCSGETAGYYRPGYERYGELFGQIGEGRHQSCLLLTGREKPYELSSAESETAMVRSLQLTGLHEDARALSIGMPFASETLNHQLIAYYRGNPMALKVASWVIRELFDGDISVFLGQGTAVFGSIRDTLAQQYARLSELECKIMHWLAIERQPVTFLDLRQAIVPVTANSKLLEALSSLRGRSLIEKATPVAAERTSSGFTQQPIVMEYATEQLIEGVYCAIKTEELEFLTSYALVKVYAEENVRQNQLRAIVEPLVERLLADFGTKQNLSDRLNKILCRLRQPNIAIGYGIENITTLLRYLFKNDNITATDFPNQVTELSDLQILQRLLESNRPGGLATWDHRIPWANNPLAQLTSETKTQLRRKNLYYQWPEGALDELRRDLRQQSCLRKRYCAWLNNTEFAEIDAEFESVQITDALDRHVDARLVFINEARIVAPPAGLLTPPQRMALARARVAS